MTTLSVDLASWIPRIERLERQIRVWRLAFICLLASVIAGAAVTAGARTGRMVEAEMFVLTDSQGRSRAVLTTDSAGNAGLQILDAAGTTAVLLAARPAGAVLAFFDKRNQDRASVLLTANGPALSLSDDEGNQRVSLRVGPLDQSPALDLTGKEGSASLNVLLVPTLHLQSEGPNRSPSQLLLMAGPATVSLSDQWGRGMLSSFKFLLEAGDGRVIWKTPR